MNAEPRRHHFLPQFYLAGFTASGERDGVLHVIGRQDGARWRGTPATVGHQRDFYRIDGVDDIDPNEVERAFSELETDMAAALRSVIMSERIPEDPDAFTWLINFVALMQARVPRMRDVFARPDG